MTVYVAEIDGLPAVAFYGTMISLQRKGSACLAA
jgi:hypothetical protein